MGANLSNAGGLWIEINQRPSAEHGPGPFQGPSSYPQLCWWSLIWNYGSGAPNDLHNAITAPLRRYIRSQGTSASLFKSGIYLE
jgi:hypothetical protein